MCMQAHAPPDLHTTHTCMALQRYDVFSALSAAAAIQQQQQKRPQPHGAQLSSSLEGAASRLMQRRNAEQAAGIDPQWRLENASVRQVADALLDCMTLREYRQN